MNRTLTTMLRYARTNFPQRRIYYNPSLLSARPYSNQPLDVHSSDINHIDAKDAHQPVFKDATVGQVLKSKGIRHVYMVNENELVEKAIELMIEKKIGAIVIENDYQKMTGIFTERDFLNNRGLLLNKKNQTEKLKLKDVMTKQVITIDENEPVASCLKLMTNKKFRHLPVHAPTDVGKCQGLISLGDLVNHILTEQQISISYLKDFVTRTY
eukprot:TRINITY_DN6706_c0_g1_i1.p1 TRINITY_DN6706_c0_g1~~TRINITY_DN6706_c0_g1_i1.p1  ORF type:complete len:221 (+),score=43.51 TRINITY_DN6706_c0_g1_i1:30-665(+)